MNEDREYVEKVKTVSVKGLDTLIRALDGEDVTPVEIAAAKVGAPMELKRQSNVNGHNRNMISLMKIGITDKQMREQVALDVLKKAGVDVPRLASGGDVSKKPQVLDVGDSTASGKKG